MLRNVLLQDQETSTSIIRSVVGVLYLTGLLGDQVDHGTFYISAPSLPCYAERKPYN